MVQFNCPHKGNFKKKFDDCNMYNLGENRYKKEIKVHEEKATFIGINENEDEYTVHRIDTCIVTPTAQTPKQSDYLYINMKRGDFYIVELKGNDIYTAYSQLLKTYKNISGKINEWGLNGKRYACVVVSGKRGGITRSVNANIDEKQKELEKNHFKIRHNYKDRNGSTFSGLLKINLATGEIAND